MVIIDNHSNSTATTMLHNLSCWDSQIYLMINDDNLGIATALNQGMQWAKERGYQWAILFDQDSIATDSMIEVLQAVYDDYKPKDKIAVIGSNYYEVNSHRLLKNFKSNGDRLWVKWDTVITAGSLLSITAFEFIGPFRDEFFIDMVDHEYCLRAYSKGFKIILACKPLMYHAIGITTTHKLPWQKTITTNHSKFRRYYMARNHAVLVREYLFKNPKWILKSLYSRFRSTTLMCFFEKDRLIKLQLMILGAFDGLTSNFSRKLS